MIVNKKEMIKKKGFSINMETDTDNKISPFEDTDFSKIRVGAKTLDDAILTLGDYPKASKNSSITNKTKVLQAIENRDFEQMRAISDYFFETSGIYSRLCRYMAYLYRYDWMVTPFINEDSSKAADKALGSFYQVLLYLDNFSIKKFLGEVALKVIKNGCYYGYLIPGTNKMNVQELPPNYCRSRFTVSGRAAIEFNMKYFDQAFKDANQRMRMLNLFPQEFKKGYIMYKEGKLPPQFAGDVSG